MSILFDSKDSLIDGPDVNVIRTADLFRDWIGHHTSSYVVDQSDDFEQFADTTLILTADNAGPYDITNGISLISGVGNMDCDTSIVATTSGLTKLVDYSCWVDLTDVPIPASEFELSFLRITNTTSQDYLEIFFLLNTNGTIQLRCKTFMNQVLSTATHPDVMVRDDWTFFAVRFDHTSVADSDTIYMDPGNDNSLGFDPGPNLRANTYNLVEMVRGDGQSPGNVKEIKFANLLLGRFAPVDVSPQDITFLTPGETSWDVPADVSFLTITLWSGGGGGGGGGSLGNGGDGGGSGFTKATHAVTPGETLTIWVGGGGGFGIEDDPSAQGGGSGATSSVWRTGGTVLMQMAGAGAGAGGGDNSSVTEGGQGGPGGGTTGVDGSPSGTSLPGIGGTQSVGGAGGVGNNTGETGVSLVGGRGANGSTGLGGANNAGSVNGAAGGHFDTGGFAGGGAGAPGYFGGGGGGSSVSGNAGGSGGGGGSGFIIAGATSTTTTQGSGATPAGTGDPLYVAPVGTGGGGGNGGVSRTNGETGADGRTILSYTATTASWRAVVRGFSAQVDFDTYMIEVLQPVRYWRTSEFDLGAARGDRFIHDNSRFLNPGYAPNGTLGRQVSDGPLDTSNSYLYDAGCVAQNTIFYASMSDWSLSYFTYFKQPASINSDGSWFIRFENDANEFIQIERDGDDVTFRAQFSDLSQHVFTDTNSSLVNGSWHLLTMAANNTNSGWVFGIDGVNVMGQPSAVLTLSAPFKRVRWGNISVNLALSAWANYLDSDLLTALTGLTTEAAIRLYIASHTDNEPGGVDVYAGYYPQQDIHTGEVPLP